MRSRAAPGASIHDYGDAGNVHKHIALEFGTVDAEMATADHVREDLFFFEGNTHLPMEQHASLAQWSADGKVTVWSSTQTPHYLHRALAKVLEMPAAHVRVIATRRCGFGGKSDPFNHEIVVAAFARRTGRPVKIALTREEVFYCHRGRHPTLMRIKTGVKRDGRIVAMDFTSFLDGGAYGSYGVASTYYTGALQTVTYECHTIAFGASASSPTRHPVGRSAGTERRSRDSRSSARSTRSPKTCRSIRRCSKAHPSARQFRHRELAAHRIDGTRRVHRCRGRAQRVADEIPPASLRPRRGDRLLVVHPRRGAADLLEQHAALQVPALSSTDPAVSRRSADRRTSWQGSDSVLAYCVADVLGIEPEDIRIVTGDTDLTPVDLGSYSSRVTLMTGNAAVQASERARDILADGVSRKLNVPKVRLVFADRRVFDTESPDHGVTFAEAVQIAEGMFGTVGTTGSYTPPRSPGRYKGQAWVRRRRTRTARRSPRSRWIRRRES